MKDLLNKFGAWVTKNNPSDDSNPLHADNSVLITKYVLMLHDVMLHVMLYILIYVALIYVNICYMCLYVLMDF